MSKKSLFDFMIPLSKIYLWGKFNKIIENLSKNGEVESRSDVVEFIQDEKE